MVYLAILIASVGGVLLWIGLSGRRVNDDPWCAACGYDLVGRGGLRFDRRYGRAKGAPPDPGPDLCTECGTSIEVPGSVRFGRSAHRPRFVAWGASLLALGVVAGVGLAWVLLGGSSAMGFRPNWSLYAEAQLNSQSPAYDELLKRAVKGDADADRFCRHVLGLRPPARGGWVGKHKAVAELLRDARLGDAARAETVAWILACQADPAREWSIDLGSAIEHEFARGRITPVRFAEFVRATCAARLAIATNGPAAPGEKLAARLEWRWRGGALPVSVRVDLPADAVSNTDDDSSLWITPSPAVDSIDFQLFAPVVPGEHHAAAVLRVEPDPALSIRVNAIREQAKELRVEAGYEVGSPPAGATASRRREIAGIFYLGQAAHGDTRLFLRPRREEPLALEFEVLRRAGTALEPVAAATIEWSGGPAVMRWQAGSRAGAWKGMLYDTLTLELPPSLGPPSALELVVRVKRAWFGEGDWEDWNQDIVIDGTR